MPASSSSSDSHNRNPPAQSAGLLRCRSGSLKTENSPQRNRIGGAGRHPAPNKTRLAAGLQKSSRARTTSQSPIDSTAQNAFVIEWPLEGFMLTRRGFAGLVAAGFTEFAFAQRSAVDSMNVQAPKGTVWLNANEFPEGPPAAALDAIARAAKESNRYHFTEYPAIHQS